MIQNENVIKSNSPVISCEGLKQLLEQNNLVVLMTAMKNPVSGKDDSQHLGFIPGARFFDFEHKICDIHSGLPHTMPGKGLFERKVAELGISNDSVVVVYDNTGIYCSARVWWMFKAMGHDNVMVLDGGFPAWQQNGYPVSESLTQPIPCQYAARPVESLFCDATDVLHAMNDEHFEILDARSSQRFYGQAPEPREGVRSGHIPHSKNLYYGDVLNPQQNLKSSEELSELFENIGLKHNKKLIFSCGSGVTACILALAATRCGYQHLTVYDGSWSDWGADPALPVTLVD